MEGSKGTGTAPAAAPERPPRVSAADRELGGRLGAVVLRCLSADGGAAIRAIDESGLTFTQMKVLVTLTAEEDEEPPTVKALAGSVGLSVPAASRAADGLVRRGLIARAEDRADRRQRRLTPTAKGRRLADGILAARLEGLGRFAATLSGEERRRLEAALELLLEREEIAAIHRRHRRVVRS